MVHILIMKTTGAIWATLVEGCPRIILGELKRVVLPTGNETEEHNIKK